MSVLRKVKPSKRNLKYGFDFSEDFFVYDTETWGLTPKPSKFAFACIYGKVNGKEYKKHYATVKEAREDLTTNPIYYKKTIFAHNAEYDLLSTWGNIFTNLDKSALFVGSRFICANTNVERKIRFGDSFNILQSSVEKIGKALGMEKGITPDKFKIGKKVGIDQLDIEYCFQDCKVIYTALCKFFLKVGAVKLTIASSAMHYFRSQFQENDIFYNRDLSNEFFDSYAGGRTEAFKIGNCSGKVIDINSLYPYEMIKTQFPDPNYLKVLIKPSTERFENFILKYYEGCVNATITHKDEYFGHLPLRTKINGSPKLLFPVGTFTGTWNFNELRFAISEGVVSIDKVHRVVYSTKTIDSPFKDYIESNYADRLATNDAFENLVIKYLMNALYGKFGERVRETQVYFKSIEIAMYWIESQKTPSRYKIALFSKDRNDCFVVETLEAAIQPKHSIPVFASYITSAARIDLLKEMKRTDNVLYCDTDSIFFNGSTLAPLSDKIGDWKLEDKTVTEIRGLKNYTYSNAKGDSIDMIKGIGKRAVKIAPNTWKETKYHKTKGALRRGVEAGGNFELVKTLTNHYDKRNILSNGDTTPVKII